MASMAKRAVALLMIVSVVQLSYAAVYKVGDSTGWTTLGHYDYKQWAATKTFHVGDIIIFEYHVPIHNVLRVTHAMYKACNASAPFATYATGNDSITITTHGHHYFLCGVPGHCQVGQKVDINVLRTSLAPTPTPLPSPSSVPAAKVPGPSPNNAVSLKGPFGKLELAMAVFAVFVANIA